MSALPDSDDKAFLVWECPKCGQQMGFGNWGTAQLSGPPSCSSYGHGPIEMEQKLAKAFPPPEEVFGE